MFCYTNLHNLKQIQKILSDNMKLNIHNQDNELITINYQQNIIDYLLQLSQLTKHHLSYNYTINKIHRLQKYLKINTYLEQNNINHDEILLYCTDNKLFNAKTFIIKNKIIGENIAQLLDKDFLDDKLWINLGQIIAKIHMLGIQHNNLLAENIIFLNNNWYITDFSKAKFKEPEYNGWCYRDILKLNKSLNKHKYKNYILFDLHQWKLFLESYSQYLKDNGQISYWLS